MIDLTNIIGSIENIKSMSENVLSLSQRAENIYNSIPDYDIIPTKEEVLKYLSLSPSEVKVIMIGQDPYNTPNMKEICSIINIPIVNSSKLDFNLLIEQGIMLLNSSLTATIYNRDISHLTYWKPFIRGLLTNYIIENPDIAVFCFGNQAKKSVIMIDIPNIKFIGNCSANDKYDDSTTSSEDIFDYNTEGMKLYESYQQIVVCDECGRHSIVNMDLDNYETTEVRQMGYDVDFCWEGYVICRTCNREWSVDECESIYVNTGFNHGFNAYDRDEIITLSETRFSLDGYGLLDKVTMTNQEKGDSIVLICGNVLIIYDVGYAEYHNRLKRTILIEANKIDILIIIISHKDQDHSGGLNKLISFIEFELSNIKYYLLYEGVNETNSNGFLLNTDEDYNYEMNISDELKLHCFLTKHKDPNYRSIIVILESEDTIHCLCGDQSLTRVYEILNIFSDKVLGIFQIPHHGSKHNITMSLPEAKIYIVSGKPNNKKDYVRECQINILNILEMKEHPVTIYFNRPNFNKNEIMYTYVKIEIDINYIIWRN